MPLWVNHRALGHTPCDIYMLCDAPPSSPVSYCMDLIPHVCFLPSESHLILLGDFNLPDFCWSTLSLPSISLSHFCDSLFTLNMLQLVHDPTHIHGNILDLVFSNYPDLLSVPSIDSHTPSDHYLITFFLSASVHHPPPSPPLHLLNYSKADFDSMLLYFLDVNLDFCLHIPDVNEIWFYIKREILSACHHFVPRAHVSKSPSPKWFTAAIHHSIKKCRSLHHRLKLHPTPNLTSKLHELESELGSLIHSSKLACIWA